MLDKAVKEQIKEVFKKLENPVSLIYNKSEHSKQEELIELLTEVAGSSELINLKVSDNKSAYPAFKIQVNNKDAGIYFSGIPGGHEFTSLVLAILNADHKGKMPDEIIAERIKSLKGPLKLKTFVSLSCENCPDIVQTLNLFSILNPEISHEMADGEFFQEEIKTLNIQGVPCVIEGDKLIHSGKATLLNLLEKLENEFGTSERNEPQNKDLGKFDVAVVGSGPAGTAAAIYTKRKGLKTAVIADKIGGQMTETKGIENFISVPYTEGAELSGKLNQHMGQYDINIFEHRLVKHIEKNEVLNLKLNSGENLQAKSVIIATGAKWRELGIPGEKEYIGRGVAFCPHCDGPYYKGKDIAVIGGGNSGVEAAIDLAGIVKSITLIEFLPELKADKVLVNKLESLSNVKIIMNAKTTAINGDGDKVTSVEYQDRADENVYNLKLSGVFVQIGLLPNSAFVKDLVRTNKFGEILTDNKCRTDVKNIYAAGDVADTPYKQIIIAMGEGAKAGLAVFEDQMIAE